MSFSNEENPYKNMTQDELWDEFIEALEGLLSVIKDINNLMNSLKENKFDEDDPNIRRI
jgi:hypothetical protein